MSQHPGDIRSLLAQQDATRPFHTDRDQPNTLLGIAETVLDFTPGVGDAKALFHDAPESFRSGHPILGTVDVLSAVPLLGLPFDFLRKAIRTGVDVAKGSTTGRLFRSLSDEAAEAARIGGEERALMQDILRDRKVKTPEALARQAQIATEGPRTVTTQEFAEAQRALRSREVRLSPQLRETEEHLRGLEARTLNDVADRVLGPVLDLPPARGSLSSITQATPPSREVLDQTEALARRRTGTPQRQAIEETRARFLRPLRQALDDGNSDRARRIAIDMINAERAPLTPSPRPPASVTRADFDVSNSVDDAFDRLTRGQQGLKGETDEVDRIRRNIDDLFNDR